MARRTAGEWNTVLIGCGVKPITAAKWSTIFAAVIDEHTFSAGEKELPDFLGQVLHESAMLERLEEGLYYKTPGRLMATWPTRFKALADEVPFLRNPEALANKVYGGRMGNVNPGDGFLFIGRGLVQVTGRDNYASVSRATGVDLVTNPRLLSNPKTALQASVAWWEGRIPDSAMGDLKKITRLVNGGTHGLTERRTLTARAAVAMDESST